MISFRKFLETKKEIKTEEENVLAEAKSIFDDPDPTDDVDDSYKEDDEDTDSEEDTSSDDTEGTTDDSSSEGDESEGGEEGDDSSDTEGDGNSETGDGSDDESYGLDPNLPEIPGEDGEETDMDNPEENGEGEADKFKKLSMKRKYTPGEMPKLEIPKTIDSFAASDDDKDKKLTVCAKELLTVMKRSDVWNRDSNMKYSLKDGSLGSKPDNDDAVTLCFNNIGEYYKEYERVDWNSDVMTDDTKEKVKEILEKFVVPYADIFDVDYREGKYHKLYVTFKRWGTKKDD